MASRALAFVIWAAVAASVAYWALSLMSGSRPVPLHAVVVGEAAAGGDLARLFGRGVPAPVAGPAPVAATQLKLIGVVAPRAGSADVRSGVALIALEGKPARTFRVGAAVDQELVLLSVYQRGAMLGPRDGNPTLRLELPPLPAAATGTLPVAGALVPARRQGGLPSAGHLPPPVAVPPEEPQQAGEQVESQEEPAERQGEPNDRPSN